MKIKLLAVLRYDNIFLNRDTIMISFTRYKAVNQKWFMPFLICYSPGLGI